MVGYNGRVRKKRVYYGGVGHGFIPLVFLICSITALALLSPRVAAPALSDREQQVVLGQHSSAHAAPVKKSKSIHQAKKVNQVTPKTTITTTYSNINLPPKHSGLAGSSNQELRKLAEYEQTADGAVASRMMIFTDIPVDTHQAKSDAVDMADTLKEFSHNGIQALVIMEPLINDSPVNFKNYKAGAYDAILEAYFSALKARGISDSAMGMWVYFPEANLPEWGPVDVVDFAPNVTRTVHLQKKYFPNSKSSILLDAMSYPAGSTSWDDGTYVSLSAFIKDIPKGLLDSFGLQGFPWVPAANETGESNLNPATFLNSSLAAAAANQLDTSSIWLSTGTFATAYTNDKSQTVTMSPVQRQKILNGIAQQALNLRDGGFSVAVNLFSEDKSNVGEAIDWSYKSADAQTVMIDFAKQLFAGDIEFWLFDA